MVFSAAPCCEISIGIKYSDTCDINSAGITIFHTKSNSTDTDAKNHWQHHKPIIQIIIDFTSHFRTYKLDFLFRDSLMRVTGEYQWDADRVDDVFERPPYVVRFDTFDTSKNYTLLK